MDSTSPYWDYLFGNESEALAYSESHDLKTTSIPEIAKQIAALRASGRLEIVAGRVIRARHCRVPC